MSVAVGVGGLAQQLADQARRRTRARRAVSSRSRARVHHHVGHAAHQVLAEADLRVHRAGRRQHLAARQVAQVPGDGRRAHVERDAERRVVEARARSPTIVSPSCTATVAVHPPSRRVVCSTGSTCGSHVEPGELPVPLERLEQSLQIAARIGACRARGPRRSAGARPGRPRSACASASLRTTCRWTWLSGGTSTTRSPHHARVAAEPPPSARGRALAVARLEFAERREMVGGRRDAVLGELALATTIWQRPQMPRPPHTESRSTPSVRAASSRFVPFGEPPPLARGREDDERLGGLAHGAGGASVARWRPLGAAPRRRRGAGRLVAGRLRCSG